MKKKSNAQSQSAKIGDGCLHEELRWVSQWSKDEYGIEGKNLEDGVKKFSKKNLRDQCLKMYNIGTSPVRTYADLKILFF